jgi:hypothetical protein
MNHLLLFRSLWTTGFFLETALEDCRAGIFDGVEGPVPLDATEREVFMAALSEARVPFIAEITTGGNYVPNAGLSVAAHLEEFQRKLEHALALKPLLVTALAGADAWPVSQSVDFFGRALELARGLDLPISFETHRSRPTFHPWVTRDILTQLPGMMLTADFSHWCCVCERLVMDTDAGLLEFFAGRIRHIHGRVGYDQGPQVPHPAAPEYAGALEAHERWWSAIWDVQAASGFVTSTMTPEFGPDGYLQAEPFTGKPAASLDEVNRWMALRQRGRFQQRLI